ncbi:nitric oxide reductase, NorZ apoprotein [Schinkia azotoformans MEV2011]|uniref:Nitric oxide reductase, NorZ apoprotein n=1 Tax=Schinkia azotoformans MEV2011 TaxID=1348973 RepID=A0A072NQA7_SCHAZ|nr:nitric-oxide reductase large subunit [Schinkia azotoformans]KEF39073.1 nitric oxide reductase, NorZ apoprotein [Schinkia azotoformans MEV2011]MEC1696475.1 nitric-oxide reductase large subunit [Schinkia azotoformans]MEC1718272.1 nitric-oxide reductase large subunit [Schinkia azotoformans]MEC1726315.1 nitric-oxide reductase large subunit [Schinkia azotoformans]MEC1743722.1 nitric-oxide reductase large subunit [Schinkia azotoformans]
MNYKKLWVWLSLVIIISFGILGYYGGRIYQVMPPIPERVVTEDGIELFTGQDIKDGQNVWQSIGGQELGSIWGHGAYVAPDWNADWLHREALFILDKWGHAEYGNYFIDLNEEQQAQLQARLTKEMRTNTYDEATKELVISNDRMEAFQYLSSYYSGLFMDNPELSELRDQYAIPKNTIKSQERMDLMNTFFFWSTWATVTNRPGDNVSYTNNWPSEVLVENRPTSELIIWSIISFVMLLAGVGALAWYFAVQRHKEPHLPEVYPEKDPLLGLAPTPSMKATLKYFWIVTALIVVQVGLGAVTAHYAVEGSGFYGIPIQEWIPYSVTRTWHTQLGILWIATAWLATGLYMAPAVSGYEPKWQRGLVNFLFICLLIIVVGSMAGQWMGVFQKFDFQANFWFGHQGFEYVDLGRFWQIFLTVGLFLWLFLMGRALLPAFKKSSEDRHLLAMFLLAATAIPLFYIPGLLWGQQSHLAMAEYWRWWIVHLWVEGFFEVFATVVMAFLFTRMGLLRTGTATASVLFSTIIFLFGGIIGTFHHLYFSGTPMGVLAYGAVFSALEVVPLVLIGFEAYENLTLSRTREWVKEYKYAIYCFVSVAFWNLVGAGLFGFFINPPISLYYMQGLNTTPLHGHTALFGVYGMLGIGLMLFCLKGLTRQKHWKTKLLSFSFWAINIGLLLMALLSLLPVGLLQTWASFEHGMWYARSAEFLQKDIVQTFVWLRLIGDTIFAIGILALGWFIIGLKTGRSLLDKNAIS